MALIFALRLCRRLEQFVHDVYVDLPDVFIGKSSNYWYGFKTLDNYVR